MDKETQLYFPLFIPEIDAYILSFLDLKTLDAIPLVNKYFSSICAEDSLVWKLFIENNYPDLVQGRCQGESWRDFARIVPELLNRKGKLDVRKLVEYGRVELLEGKKLTRVERFWLKQFGTNKAIEHGQVGVLDWLKERDFLSRENIVLETAAEKGYLEIYQWVWKEKLSIENWFDYDLAYYGHLHILVWMKQKRITLFLSGIAEGAVSTGRFDIIDWLINEIEGFELVPGIWALDLAAKNGQMKMLEYFAERDPTMLPDVHGANWAVEAGHEEILDWLADHGIFPNQEGEILAAKRGRLGILKWIERRRSPISRDPSIADIAAAAGYFHILRWLKKRGILPTVYGADLASANPEKGLAILKWIKQNVKGLLPSQAGIDLAAENGCLDILMWIKQETGYLPTEKGANRAAENGQLHILDWLITLPSPVYPGFEGLRKAVYNGYKKVLEWFKSRFGEIPFPEDLLSIAIIFGHLEIIEWILSNIDVSPSEEDLIRAIGTGNLEILDQLDQLGLSIPD